ncbi:MAG: sulfite exporter TauE/SafE family protein [Dehalococcoidia bacterium]|nr:MAG: sulfite exporter TauE/SafE family protein [Dehalococcoidia bacterium]
MSIEIIVFGSLVVLVAAFAMSITGFGFALIAAPLLLFILEPKTVVITNLMIGPVLCILILWESWRQVRIKQLVLLAVGSICGVPIGTFILANSTPAALKLIISALVVFFAVPIALGYSHHFKLEKLVFGITGIMSGILASSASLAGPPVVLLLLNQGWKKESLRASLAAYLLLTGLVALAALGISGVFSSDITLSSFTYIPAALLGFLIGRKVVPAVNPEFFRKLAIIIVLIAAIAGVITSLLTLL